MKSILRSTAVLTVAALLLPALPAGAAYESAEEITLALRPEAQAGTVFPLNDNTVCVRASDLAEGMTVHVGMFIEAETCQLSYIAAQLVSDSAPLTFSKDTFVNPAGKAYDEPVPFTLPDGTEVSSKLRPYALGQVNENGVYTADCFGMYATFAEDSSGMKISWMHGVGNAESFLGGVSDAFSFVEFDVQIAPDTPAGVYHIDFAEPEDPAAPADQQPNCITSDDGHYSDIVPSLKGAEIIVMGSENVLLDAPAEVFRYAEDSTGFSADDFGGTLIWLEEDGVHELEVDAVSVPLSPLYLNEQCPSDLEITEPRRLPVTFDAEAIPQGKITASDGSPLQYRIGRRGDVNGDGETDSTDAAAVLIYAATAGSGNEAAFSDHAEDEAFCRFLADVNGQDAEGSAIDSTDAALILTYAASAGSGEGADWETLLGMSS